MNNDHPNLALINRFFDAFIENDINEINDILDKSIKWHVPRKHPLKGTKKGIRQVLNYLSMVNKSAFKAKAVPVSISEHYVIECYPFWNNNLGCEDLRCMPCLLWIIENNKIKEVFNFPDENNKRKNFFKELY